MQLERSSLVLAVVVAVLAAPAEARFGKRYAFTGRESATEVSDG